MSKTNITISFEEEKLSALNFSLGKENSSAQQRKKLRRKLREKKIAQGHKPDDHEDTMNMRM